MCISVRFGMWPSCEKKVFGHSGCNGRNATPKNKIAAGQQTHRVRREYKELNARIETLQRRLNEGDVTPREFLSFLVLDII